MWVGQEEEKSELYENCNQMMGEQYLESTREATALLNEELSDKERMKARLVQMGASLHKDDLYKMGILESQECDYCGAEVANFDHIVWQCPYFEQRRPVMK